jgi:hypothetical protein
MSNSSQPTTSLDDLLNDITIDLSDGITTTGAVGASEYSYVYDTNNMSTITLSPTITVNSGAAGTYTTINSLSGIDTVTIDNSSFTFHMPKEWVDCFPDWDRVEDMCKKYPGLEIAFRNFQTVYQLVKDDYDNPTPKK